MPPDIGSWIEEYFRSLERSNGGRGAWNYRVHHTELYSGTSSRLPDGRANLFAAAKRLSRPGAELSATQPGPSAIARVTA